MIREIPITEKIKLDKLVKLAANYLALPYEAAFEKTRKRENVTLRQAVIMAYFEIKNKFVTLEQIGMYFGCDHATILHALKKAKIYYENEYEFNRMIVYLRTHNEAYPDIVFPFKNGFGDKEMIRFSLLGL